MERKKSEGDSYWRHVVKRFLKHRLGVFASCVVIAFCLVGVYAPFLASSKPLFVIYDGQWYFPLFKYLFYQGFYTKRLDIFFNLLSFTLPLLVFAFVFLHRKLKGIALAVICIVQVVGFLYFSFLPPSDPAGDQELAKQRNIAFQQLIRAGKLPSWQFDLQYMNTYAKLNLLIREKNLREQDNALAKYRKTYTETTGLPIPSLWHLQQENKMKEIAGLQVILEKEKNAVNEDSLAYKQTNEKLIYILDRSKWIAEQEQLIDYQIMPLLSEFHWEDDAGGQQALNQYVDWWDLTRINRKDLLAALIFGVRISLVVGLVSIALALLIGIPVGAYAGFYGGKLDILVSRLLEIWEAMPIFFMLLLVIAFLQSKSIFLVILVIGLFGWTGFSRYIRGEFFKQRHLPYVEACQSLGFRDNYIIFKHILPNAIPPVLTLLPFAIMGAITSEAGLSFLGLGEENSCSWGVLMDEGRTAFPAESYLLWPPAILLTVLLVAIAIVGDSLRDTLDPKLR